MSENKHFVNNLDLIIDGVKFGTQADWDVNDSTSGKYINNRTHYSEAAYKNAIRKTSVSGFDVTTEPFYEVQDPFVFNIVLGTEYIVNWDGVDYKCVASDENDAGYPCIGNSKYTSYMDKGDIPFAIWDNGYELCVTTKSTAESHVLSIQKRVDDIIHQLDEKYIPDTIQRVLTGESNQYVGFNSKGKVLVQDLPEQVNSDWDEDDYTSKAYIKNKPILPVHGKKIVEGYANDQLRIGDVVYTVDNKAKLSPFKIEPFLNEKIEEVIFSPDGNYLLLKIYAGVSASIYTDHAFLLFRVSGTTIEFIRNLLDDSSSFDEIRWCAFTYDGGSILALCGTSGDESGYRIRRWIKSNNDYKYTAYSLFTGLESSARIFCSPTENSFIVTSSASGTRYYGLSSDVSSKAATYYCSLFNKDRKSFTASIVTFSPDGSHLITISNDYVSGTGVAAYYSISNNKVTYITEIETKPIHYIELSPDGTKMVIGGRSKVKLYSVNGDTITYVSDLYADNNNTAITDESINDIKFSPDGSMLIVVGNFKNRLYSVTSDGVSFICDLFQDDLLRDRNTALNGVCSIDFSPDGNVLVIGGRFHGSAKIYNVTTSENSLTYFDYVYYSLTGNVDHVYNINDVVFSPDGELAVVLGDFLYGALSYRYKNGEFEYLGKIFSDGENGALTSLPIDVGANTYVDEYDDTRPKCAAFSPDGKLLALVGGFRMSGDSYSNNIVYCGYAKLYSVNGTEISYVSDISMDTNNTQFDGIVRSVSFSRDGKLLSIGGTFTGKTKLYSVDDTNVTYINDVYDSENAALTGDCTHAEFSNDGLYLYLVVDGKIERYDVADSSVTYKDTVWKNNVVHKMKLSPDGTTIVAATGTTTAPIDIRTIDTVTASSSGYASISYVTHTNNIAFSADGNVVSMGSVLLVFTDGEYKIYLDLYDDHGYSNKKKIRLTSFTPDGNVLVIVSEDGDYREVKSYKLNTNDIGCLLPLDRYDVYLAINGNNHITARTYSTGMAIIPADVGSNDARVYLYTETDNKISPPLTAEVGQVLKVKSVDAYNAPIEWETSLDQADWNQNDETAPDYVKNRTHYEYTEFVEILPETELTGVDQDGMYGLNLDATLFTGNEKQLTVTFDGTEYVCNALTLDDSGAVYFGNASKIGAGDDTGEPFFIGVMKANNVVAMVMPDTEVHTVHINGSVVNVKIIDDKYLPKYKFAGEKVAGTEYIIDDEIVTAGNGAEVFNDYENNIASGQFSHTEGSYTTASGEYSHTEGYGTTVANSNSVTTTTTVIGSKGYAGHAEGYGTVSYGRCSHAEGNGTKASGNDSHAEGYSTTASGLSSHAEGYSTTASGGYSHAEGNGTTASKNCSHAEGNGTKASGNSSHAEGYKTTASGGNSHAEGSKTIAAGTNQHAQGKYNIEDTDNAYAHIVGNGSSSACSNAHTLDWDGNAWFAGDVYVGSTSGTNKDEGSVKLSKEGHTHSWDEVTSKPFVKVGGDTLTWDGNTEGLVSVEIAEGVRAYYLSDAVPTVADFANGCVLVMSDGTTQEVSYIEMQALFMNDGCLPSGTPFIIPSDNYKNDGIGEVVFPKAGCWSVVMENDGVLIYMTSLTIPGYTGFAKEQIDPKVLPEHLQFGETTVQGDTLEWDGNTEGLVSVDMGDGAFMYKVSDAVPVLSNFANGATVATTDGVETNAISFSAEELMDMGHGVLIYQFGMALVPTEAVGADIEGLIFTEAGTYFIADGSAFVTSLTIHGYSGFTKTEIKPIDEKFIPDTVPTIQSATVGQTIRVSAVDENGVPTAWEAFDPFVLTDENTGTKYKLTVVDSKLTMTEVTV